LKAPAPRILMVGTALEGKGGVAAVVSVLRKHGLFERERVRYIATHREGSKAVKAKGAVSGFWHTLLACFSQHPAVVHVHAASRASFVRKSIVLLIARLAGCKTIFHLHGGGFRQFATVEAGTLMRRWIRHTLEASSVVITLSNGWAGFVRGFAPKARVMVVPNSVPVASASHVQPEPGRILFLGRLETAKGVFELLGAGALLAQRFPELRLVFGSGSASGSNCRAGSGKTSATNNWRAPACSACRLTRKACRCPCWRRWRPVRRWSRAMWEGFRKPSSTATTASWRRLATRKRWPAGWRRSWATRPCGHGWHSVRA
jgi:glycosyltransferase involved in cell wall biosynthesis